MELHYTNKYDEPRRVFASYNLRLDSREDPRAVFEDLVNNIKILLEDILRQPLSFWPLCQPRAVKPHPKFFRRIFWDCDCGMEMHADIPLDRSDSMKFQFIETSKSHIDVDSSKELPQNFQIYFCATGGCGRDVMRTLKSSDLRTDKDLFERLYRTYAEIRGWKLLFSFTHVHDISSGGAITHADIRKAADSGVSLDTPIHPCHMQKTTATSREKMYHTSTMTNIQSPIATRHPGLSAR
ncbi:hypothetical protein TWF506_004427 [Arthrobotrys conoides]|uniref:Uncharacterized protein n=1 Tax=Arthrobotrys conoides TaxID=74498 RepID=A0AAN8RPC0_9PEZI